MKASDPLRPRKPRNKVPKGLPQQYRKDGWTAERQLCFLDALLANRSVAEAAAAAGMTRESAYRLRERRDGALFAALWDRMLEPACEVHMAPLTDGRLARILGNFYRRESGDFARIAESMQRGRAANRKVRL